MITEKEINVLIDVLKEEQINEEIINKIIVKFCKRLK